MQIAKGNAVAQSKIEWCSRSDWNPIRGCTRASEGCRNCYAEAIAARFSDPGQPFYGFAERTPSGPRWTGKLALQESRLGLPLRWRKPARIFVNSTSDLFHDDLPDEAIDRVFAVMALAPQHTFLVLTKRAQRMRDYIRASGALDRVAEAVAEIGKAADQRSLANPPRRMVADADHKLGINAWAGSYNLTHGHVPWPLPNCWKGVSVEDQARADERIPLLLDTPAAKRFLSCEPLLGPVDLRNLPFGPPEDHYKPRILDALTAGRLSETPWHLDWCIAGGESGPGARPMSIQWARSLRDQCRDAGVAFFFKQFGEWAPAGGGPAARPGRFAFGDYEHEPGTMVQCDGYPRQFTMFGARSVMQLVGKKAAGRLLDGVEHSEFPA
jgi:protein gp37